MEGEIPEGGCWEVATAAEGTREVENWEGVTLEEVNLRIPALNILHMCFASEVLWVPCPL